MRSGGIISQDRLDRILPLVTRPARYTGGEWNAVVKEWDATPVRLALLYPDTYEIGMSNLGLMILYDLVNAQPHMLAERAYAPWTDMEAALREAGIPLFSLETRHPLSDFDVLGFSLQYELTYANILNMLDLAGIPIHAAQRTPEHPLVIAGGSGALNPEPLADFFDLFVVGDGEAALVELLHAYGEAKGERGRLSAENKERFLRDAASIPGSYVPSLYRVSYHEDGRIADMSPRHPGAPERILRRMVRPLPPSPTRLVMPYVETVHDRAVIELQRGCTQGCRFCQAGMIYRPIRERPVEEVMATVAEMLDATGYDELGLLSLSSSDYSHIEELVGRLTACYDPNRFNISLPSLRVDAFSVSLAEMIQQGRKSGLTFAPEAGSQRLRDVINKNVCEEDLINTAQVAFEHGWHLIKLYFMLGLPTEGDEDVEAIADLVHQVYHVGRQARGRRAQVNVSVSTLVPKPHTPFQWLPLVDLEVVRERQRRLRDRLRGRGIKLSWHEPESTFLEAVLCRGDRRLGRVIERAWRNGARFDAWHEHFDFDLWLAAFEGEGIDPAFYGSRLYQRDEVFPWDHISCGVDRRFLWAEYQRALEGQTTSDCRGECHACGLRASYGLAACPPLGGSS